MVKCEKGTCRYGAQCIQNKVCKFFPGWGKCTRYLRVHLKGICAVANFQIDISDLNV